jgi:hypothetical protein
MEHFVNLMVTTWDQGIFLQNPSPPSPPPTKREKLHAS